MKISTFYLFLCLIGYSTDKEQDLIISVGNSLDGQKGMQHHLSVDQMWFKNILIKHFD